MQEILTNSQAELLWLTGLADMVEMANMAEINEVSFATQEQTEE